MHPVYLVTLLHVAIHGCFTGSKVLLALLALEFGASQFTIGVLAACYAVAPALLGVHAGRLSDRIGMRIPMLAGALVMTAAMLTGWLWHTLAALFVVAGLVGVSFALFIVSVQNLTGGLPGERTRNYSILTVGYSVSNFVGPMTAGFAIDYAGHAAAFLAFALFTVLPIVVLALHGSLTRVDVPRAPQATGGVADLLHLPALRRQVVITGLLMAAWEIYIFYLPIYAHSIGLPASTIGIILGGFATATLLIRFALPAITRRMNAHAVLAASALIAAAACVAFPMLQHPHALMLASFIIGLGLGCGQPLSLTLSYESSPPGRTGEVAGLRLIASNIARITVPLLSGTLGTVLGAAPVFWLNALALSAISHLARRSGQDAPSNRGT
ncbi:MAG: MFS transporter [Burkholderiales bacterium]|nr:MFS transporter [Burkholderiales bacterium]